VPVICIAWLIGVEDYAQVRENNVDPQPDLQNIYQAPKDIEKMEAFFERRL